jgi:hypothetical protein
MINQGIAKIEMKYDRYFIRVLYPERKHPVKSIPLYTMESTLRHFFDTYPGVALLEEEEFNQVLDTIQNGVVIQLGSMLVHEAVPIE